MSGVMSFGTFDYADRQEGGYVLLQSWGFYTGIHDWSARVYDNITKVLILEHTALGVMTMHAGYMWNGASVIPDTKSNMRAGCGHDGGYRLLRESKMPQSFRIVWDRWFAELYIQDGGWPWWAWTCFGALRSLGASSAAPQREVDTIKRQAP